MSRRTRKQLVGKAAENYDIATTQQIYQHDNLDSRREALTRLEQSLELDGNANSAKELALPSLLPSNFLKPKKEDALRASSSL